MKGLGMYINLIVLKDKEFLETCSVKRKSIFHSPSLVNGLKNILIKMEKALSV